jgi:hypothetical protein
MKLSRIAMLVVSTACFMLVCLAFFQTLLQYPSAPMLLLKMCTGGCGIGNQMFVYASGLGIAKETPEAPICVYAEKSTTHNQVHPGSIMAKHVDLVWPRPIESCTRQMMGDATYFTLQIFGNVLGANLGILDRFSPPHTMYEPFRFDKRAPLVIDSSLESFKYFLNLSHPIYQLKQHDAAARWMAKRGLTSTVHVRRGDKLLNGEPVAPLAFYKAALRLLGHGRVAVCTDDVPWVLQQRVFENASISSADPGFDMALLAAATDTVIIGIGTFGWWGAFLSRAQRKIFYPIQFTGEAAAGYSESDYIPYGVPGQGEWIPLLPAD